ncbi:MAG: four helix bundle protein [Alphaproteobacteria bacterium]|nr:four helix bundle protein [Alphaproteobacteria bacterium]
MIKYQNHKDLLVFQRAYKISLEIYKQSRTFPKEEQYAITDQLRRSATSICANIAEGYGRQLTSKNDFKRFLIIAKGSCQEVGVWIDYCKDLSFIDQKTSKMWEDEYTEISKMLYALIQRQKSGTLNLESGISRK